MPEKAREAFLNDPLFNRVMVNCVHNGDDLEKMQWELTITLYEENQRLLKALVEKTQACSQFYIK